MISDLGSLECRICGQAIYFPLNDLDDTPHDGHSIELTCSRGHSDSYFHIPAVHVHPLPPNSELARAAAVGF